MSIRFGLPLLLAGLVLIMPVARAAPEEAWQGSSLSDETLKKVQLALVDYQRCINEDTQARINDRLDSRAMTDAILKQCEEKLGAVKTAFDQEKVPAEVSDRYMRSRRTHAARNILKTIMGIQALRAGSGQTQPQP